MGLVYAMQLLCFVYVMGVSLDNMINAIIEDMKSSDAKASKCHWKFSS